MDANAIGFRPNDIEIFTYLAQKASGQSPAREDYMDIPTIDIYGNLEPWELFEELSEERVHFFTNSKDDRSIGAGAWKLWPQHTRQLSDIENELVGVVQRYEYRNPSKAHQDRRWRLDEYTLAADYHRIKPLYKGLRFCTLLRVPYCPTDAAEMRCQRIFDAALVKYCSRKRKAPMMTTTDDVC